MHHLDLDVADADSLPRSHCPVREPDPRLLREVDGCPRGGANLERPGDEVGVKVRVENGDDLETSVARRMDVSVGSPVGVHEHGSPGRHVHEVRPVAQALVEKHDHIDTTEPPTPRVNSPSDTSIL